MGEDTGDWERDSIRCGCSDKAGAIGLLHTLFSFLIFFSFKQTASSYCANKKQGQKNGPDLENEGIYAKSKKEGQYNGAVGGENEGSYAIC